MVEIVYIREEHIQGFWECLDSVARERRWLGTFEAYPLERMEKFVKTMIENDYPQYEALEDEKVVAWVDIGRLNLPTTQHVGELGMGILKEHRGQGLGTHLMQNALNHARNFGFKRVQLSVFAHNTAGIALYKKMGFLEEGRRKNAALLDDGYIDLVEMGLCFED